MDDAQHLLFGRFPRSVGSPEQHLVHSVSEFDLWQDTIRGRRNAYASVAWFPIEGPEVVSDKVSYDFDAPAKETAFPEDMPDDERIEVLRDDAETREEVLGGVCRDARKLARASMADDIPVVGVFSGFGLHVHQLFQPASVPGDRMGSTARYYRESLDLTTLDHAPIGDVQRIMRVPNMKRVHTEFKERYVGGSTRLELIDRQECDLWTIPLSGAELTEVDPDWLMEASRNARVPDDFTGHERPSMPKYDEYIRSSPDFDGSCEGTDFSGDIADEGIEWFVRELLKMPCITENILLDPEPPHKVRVNAAVLLFNIGFSVSEALDLFGQLGWRDWDREVTRKHLRHIYQKGYSDMNCGTLRDEGFCTRSEDPEACPCFGWSGGEPEW